MSTRKQLRAAGSMLRMDCGDSSCLYTQGGGGMRTNGGCTCDLPQAVRSLQDKLTTLLGAAEAMQCLVDHHMSGDFDGVSAIEDDDPEWLGFRAAVKKAREGL